MSAVVTGASRGLGRAIAEAYLRAGANVVVNYNRTPADDLVTLAESLGRRAVAVPADVSKTEDCERLISTAVTEFGKIDVLVNNAGITRDGLLARMSDADWNDVIQTNLTSCFHWTKAIGWPMCRARFGRIVNISSVTGIMGNAGQANYAAAKAGMIGFTKATAKEFAKRGVTVNVVAPGFIKTDMTAELSEEVQKGATALIPMQRFGEAAEIASAVAFFCSDEASYITGQVFAVDGGMAM
jgi:3-oxoacyl-[acyl-carrier protein] reductase